MTGRPERNSARPRSTATCLGVPNKPDVPLPAMSHTYVFGSRRPQNHTDPIRTHPGAFYSVGGVFLVARVCSHLPAKYHGTMQEAPKAGIR
jgi:hypothetical protein